MKICSVGTELLHGADGRADGGIDGQTDTTKLTVALRNFANAPPPQKEGGQSELTKDWRLFTDFTHGMMLD